MLILFQDSELNCGTKFLYLKETSQKINAFNRKIKQNLTSIINAEDYYNDVSEIFLKMKSFFAQNST